MVMGVVSHTHANAPIPTERKERMENRNKKWREMQQGETRIAVRVPMPHTLDGSMLGL